MNFRGAIKSHDISCFTFSTSAVLHNNGCGAILFGTLRKAARHYPGRSPPAVGTSGTEIIESSGMCSATRSHSLPG